MKLIYFCSYDYGALLAIDLKMKHPARALGIVLESKVCRFDMTGFAHMTTCFSFLDEKYVKSGKGLKGKIAFLWTLQHKGRPDPGMRQRHSKYGTRVSKLLPSTAKREKLISTKSSVRGKKGCSSLIDE